ncbi:hypothetical protein [Leptolyngbya sp. FACHB-261]|uniref:hypothetical protein n=1 Tax=Leptolyngbya sp. FACHB-261 TaxID=2692806 RepID=UPI001683636A|nr:hypothetical protein [Leptolyngbya sp. FACHB-261]MBD2103880.1 hypothetical protein [Leptolyngbya sp. FACHB-261]
MDSNKKKFIDVSDAAAPSETLRAEQEKLASDESKQTATSGTAKRGDSFLELDAGPDTSRADYANNGHTDRNGALHDDENVDVPIPKENQDDIITAPDSQLGIIGRMPG